MRRACTWLVVWVALGCAAPREVARISPEDIQALLTARRAELGACVAAHREREPGRHGKVLLRFSILPSGTAQPNPSASEGPPELLGCLLAVVADTKFPAHREDAGLITWPLAF